MGLGTFTRVGLLELRASYTMLLSSLVPTKEDCYFYSAVESDTHTTHKYYSI